jgi:hypothetical protein
LEIDVEMPAILPKVRAQGASAGAGAAAA